MGGSGGGWCWTRRLWSDHENLLNAVRGLDPTLWVIGWLSGGVLHSVFYPKRIWIYNTLLFSTRRGTQATDMRKYLPCSSCSHYSIGQTRNWGKTEQPKVCTNQGLNLNTASMEKLKAMHQPKPERQVVGAKGRISDLLVQPAPQ